MNKTTHMEQWINNHNNNLHVKAWLERNPPPKDWQGTAMEWAYTEMPLWNVFLPRDKEP